MHPALTNPTERSLVILVPTHTSGNKTNTAAHSFYCPTRVYQTAFKLAAFYSGINADSSLPMF